MELNGETAKMSIHGNTEGGEFGWDGLKKAKGKLGFVPQALSYMSLMSVVNLSYYFFQEKTDTNFFLLSMYTPKVDQINSYEGYCG